ncbi:S8 family serine peptidase [Oculatella sp. LEGE 06141]|uniref:S8 family peptidase n=1 Tax=Oculatella sp. LEGE 06141 TaxID=1828648 RepID=UPI00187E2ED0|nr:S8 family peptidase [Oculatella sp. LEGE 06141]MBE9179021.1 S8 family serine peptidase [Oculatella sp. LEGE 06141]
MRFASTQRQRALKQTLEVDRTLDLKAVVKQFIRPTQQIRGELSPADRNQMKRGDRFARQFLRGDRFVDEYRLVKAKIGQQIHVQLNSFSFDTYLQLVDRRTNTVLFQNDDANLGYTTDSSLTFIVQPGVDYTLRISSFHPNQTGRYHLSTRGFQARSTPQFNFAYGYGLIDAAAAIAQVAGRSPVKNGTKLGGSNWSLDLVKAPAVWQRGFTGKGTVVAVIDTGVDYHHPDLQANIWKNVGDIPNNGIDDDGNGYIDDVRGWNFVNGNNDPMDWNGHGTHVSGTIAATNNKVGVTGVAYDAQIMPVKVLDDDGFGSYDAIARGIRYAVQNGADVINLSLGGSELGQAQKSALRLARQKGVVVVMASGNERQIYGTTRPNQPALASTIGLGLAVGAIDKRRKVADFSNPTGNRPLDFVVAPGVNVRSTVPGGRYESYGWNGTSMATPHVAGVAALLLSAAPNLTPVQIEHLITTTANPQGITYI